MTCLNFVRYVSDVLLCDYGMLFHIFQITLHIADLKMSDTVTVLCNTVIAGDI